MKTILIAILSFISKISFARGFTVGTYRRNGLSLGRKPKEGVVIMKKDWRFFSEYALRSLKGSIIGLLLVPIFFFLMNPHLNGESLPSLLMSLRIGLTVVITTFFVSTFVYGAIYLKSPERMINIKKSVKFRFATGFVGMSLGLTLASFIESMVSGHHMGIEGVSIGLTIGGLTYLAFILKAAYAETQNNMLKLRAESAESKLNVLKNQMQPHFLFNSLNSLAELIDSNKDYASQMTQKLSDLYREILESSKTQFSSLESEISIIQKYLDLESLRFGSRLKYDIQKPEMADQIFIPSLLLQTLVENAVKHGISQSIQGGMIGIFIHKRNLGYQVRIENTSSKKTRSLSSTGTGLANTVSRLDLIYGKEHNFNMNIQDDKVVVEFWFSGEKSV